jgi:hypothetical protein
MPCINHCTLDRGDKIPRLLLGQLINQFRLRRVHCAGFF